MERQEVNSSSIDSIGYDEENQILEIEFRDGVYQYENVPEYVYIELINSGSIGGFFNEDIKQEYSCSRVG